MKFAIRDNLVVFVFWNVRYRHRVTDAKFRYIEFDALWNVGRCGRYRDFIERLCQEAAFFDTFRVADERDVRFDFCCFVHLYGHELDVLILVRERVNFCPVNERVHFLAVDVEFDQGVITMLTKDFTKCHLFKRDWCALDFVAVNDT